MKIGFGEFSNKDLEDLLYHNNSSFGESLAVWGRRVSAFFVTGKWLDSEHLFKILSKSPSSNQIPIIFKNAKISPSLAQKISTIATPITPNQNPTNQNLSASIPMILNSYLREEGNKAAYNPQGKSITYRRPNLVEFFINPNAYKNDYDMGFEDEFGVPWIDPSKPEDADFLRLFKEKYKNSLNVLNQLNHPFLRNETARFANNDSFAFLNLGQPFAKEMIRDIMLWGATREVCRIKNVSFPHKEVIKTIFG